MLDTESGSLAGAHRQRPVVLTAQAIAAIPDEPLGRLDGVVHRILWRDERSTAGVLRVEPGRRLGEHTHRVNHHHLWLLEGRAAILGTELGPGAYVHVPSGVEHDIDASATEGCTVYYLYLRHAEAPNARAAPAGDPGSARPHGGDAAPSPGTSAGLPDTC